MTRTIYMGYLFFIGTQLLGATFSVNLGISIQLGLKGADGRCMYPTQFFPENVTLNLQSDGAGDLVGTWSSGKYSYQYMDRVGEASLKMNIRRRKEGLFYIGVNAYRPGNLINPIGNQTFGFEIDEPIKLPGSTSFSAQLSEDTCRNYLVVGLQGVKYEP